MTIRALVVDDQQAVRAGLAALLDTQEDITVVATAADGEEAVQQSDEHRLTNPMAMRPNIHELIPSQPQRVTVRLPQGTKATKVQLLVAGGSVPVEQSGGTVKLTVHSVLDHEVIAIDLA